MACFADINVSQGSVATYARCGGIFIIHLTTNLPKNFPVKIFNRFSPDTIVAMSLWPHFFGPPCRSSKRIRRQARIHARTERQTSRKHNCAAAAHPTGRRRYESVQIECL